MMRRKRGLDLDLNQPAREEIPTDELQAAKDQYWSKRAQIRKAQVLAGLRQQYPSDDAQARKEVLDRISYNNSWLYRELMGKLEYGETPLRQVQSEYEPKFNRCINS